MRALRGLCDEHDLVLAWDETPLGLGRSGTLTLLHGLPADARPDAAALGDSLTAGYGTCGALLAAPHLAAKTDHEANRWYPGWEPHPFAASVAAEILHHLVRHALSAQAAKAGTFLTDQIEHRLTDRVRTPGRGGRGGGPRPRPAGARHPEPGKPAPDPTTHHPRRATGGHRRAPGRGPRPRPCRDGARRLLNSDPYNSKTRQALQPPPGHGPRPENPGGDMTQRIDAARHRKPKPRSWLWRARWWLGALLQPFFVNEPAATQRPRPAARTSLPRTVSSPRPPAPTRAPRNRVPEATAEDIGCIQRPNEKPGQDPADRQLAALIRQWAAQHDHRNPTPSPGPNRKPYRGRHRGTEPAAVTWPCQPMDVEDDDPGPLVRPYLFTVE
ncbi:aminotransferase class III-fold pyridoxal phosphate-dependent enzyme [Thermobifida halotolerans]|uniref:Aminotransferase class III-fold pyridoxal phosphate-dependent enzyme n=3 Tax=Thermobifida halotolerans TaxID=483545 RepID=A0AA97M0P5_9ACTN|nr:aminotransferase class III-fold pyridoxal phosphate-dependent enzyme [Thermobifida halotolerans]